MVLGHDPRPQRRLAPAELTPRRRHVWPASLPGRPADRRNHQVTPAERPPELQARPGRPPEPAAGAPFGVRAGLYGLTTLTGGHFGYALKAGARIEDSAVVYNQSDEARTFHVYGAAVTNAAGGGLAPAQEGQKMAAVGAWLKLGSEATFTVRPKSRATVRFSLAVPVGTPPGSYLGSLVTALRTPAVSGGVNTETRIARLVELTVPGTADLQVSLTELEHRPADGGEEFTVTVRNTGNVLYTFAGTLNITGGSSAYTVPLTPTGIYVIPGGSATITGRLADLPALGRRAVTASVTATVPGGAAKTVDSNTVRLSSFPQAHRHPRRRRLPCPGPSPRHHAQAPACLAAASRRGTYRDARTTARTAVGEPACRRPSGSAGRRRRTPVAGATDCGGAGGVPRRADGVPVRYLNPIASMTDPFEQAPAGDPAWGD